MEKPFSAHTGGGPYVFVSYDHDDAETVYQDIKALKDAGLNIWYDEGISPGLSWRDEVAQALAGCDVVLFFGSPRSVASSNCLKELNFALSRERRILVAYLEPTELPPGLELSLSDVQAVIRQDYQAADYLSKLARGLGELLDVVPPDSSPPVGYAESSAPDLNAIAVLPFGNRSSDPDNEYLCDGIAETLTNALSGVDDLKVASHLSASSFKGRNVDVSAVGKALSVGSVVSGTVQKSGDRLRISVALNSVGDGLTLWSRQYNMVLADIFDVQDDVARQVIEALKIELMPSADARLLTFGTDNAEAYNALMLGNYECHRHSHGGLNRAIGFYRQAVQLDDELAEAHGRLGMCYWGLTHFGVPREDVIDSASRAFTRARELGFDLHGTRFWNSAIYSWEEVDAFLSDSAVAAENFLQNKLMSGIAMLCNPDDPEARESLITGVLEVRNALVNLRLFRATVDLLQRYSDDEHACHYEIGDALSALGEHQEAIPHLTAALVDDSQHHFARHARGLAYLRVGDLSRASEDLKILTQVWPKSFYQFLHYYWNGEIDAAREYFLENFAERPRFEIRLKVVAWTMLGDFEKALEVLNRSRSTIVEPIPYNLSLYAPQHCIDGLLREPAYVEWLDRFGMSDAHREKARQVLNEISHVTGVIVSEA